MAIISRFILLLLIHFFVSAETSLAQDSLDVKPKTHKPKLIGAPVVAYAPETSLQFGAGLKYLFKIQKGKIETRTSYIACTFRYTLLNQIIFNPNYLIFSNEEKYLLKGKIGYLKFPQYYFGIGNKTPNENKEDFAMSSLGFEQLLYRKIIKNFYVGGGYRYFKVYNVELENDGVLSHEKPPGYKGSLASGLMFGITYDARDNVLNSSKGELIEFTSTFHGKYLGGDFNFTTFQLDARKYIKVFEHRKDILAFQYFAMYCTDQTPFTELSLLGGDKIMRGYYKGRYRDRNMLILQAEYRMHIYGRLGATAFGGLGDVSPKFGIIDFSEIKPSVGGGLRILISRPDNLNLRIDYAFGKKESHLYINIAEAF